MNDNADRPVVLAPHADRSSADVDEQRRELQRRIDSLRLAGALPAADEGDASNTVAQWTNWSNG